MTQTVIAFVDWLVQHFPDDLRAPRNDTAVLASDMTQNCHCERHDTDCHCERSEAIWLNDPKEAREAKRGAEQRGGVECREGAE